MATKKMDEGFQSASERSGSLEWPYNAKTDGVSFNSGSDTQYTPLSFGNTTPRGGGGGGGGGGGAGGISSISYNSTTNILTITQADGTSQTVTIQGGDLSTDAGNDLTLGSDGNLYFAETTTSLAYDPALKTLIFTNEDGNVTTINLAALTTDIYITGASLAGSTLTLTDNDAATPDVTVDLAGFASSMVDNGDGTYTHTSGDGTVTTIAGGADEVISSAGALSGAAPIGAQWGVDTTTGASYYVDGAGNWAAGASAGDNIYTADGTLTGNRNLDGNGYNLFMRYFNQAVLQGPYITIDSNDVNGRLSLYSRGQTQIGAGNSFGYWPTTGGTVGQVLTISAVTAGGSATYNTLVWADPPAGGGGNPLATADQTLTANRIVDGGGTFDLELQNIDELNARANDIYFQGTNGVTLTSTSGPVSVLADTELTLANSTGRYSWPTTAPAVGDVLTVTSTATGQHTMAWQPASGGGGNSIYTADGTLPGHRFVDGLGNNLEFANLGNFNAFANSLMYLTSGVGTVMQAGSQGFTFIPGGNFYKTMELRSNYITFGDTGDQYVFPAGGPTAAGDVLTWTGTTSGSAKSLVWAQPSGGANSIYTADGTLTGNRTVNGDGNNLVFANLGGAQILAAGSSMTLASNATISTTGTLNAQGNDIYLAPSNLLFVGASSGTNTYAMPSLRPTAGQVLTWDGITYAGSHPKLSWGSVSGGGDNIYTTNGTLTEQRVITLADNGGVQIRGDNNTFATGTSFSVQCRSISIGSGNTSDLVNVGGLGVMLGANGGAGGYTRIRVNSHYWEWPENFGAASSYVLQQGGVFQPTMVWADPATLTSDARLKDVTGPLDVSAAVDAIRALKPAVYSWKHDEEKVQHAGFIAQEVQEVLPSAVSTDDTEDKALRINYMDVIANLTAAVQHLMAEVEELKAAQSA